MGFWALAAPVIASVAGSLLNSKSQNDAASKVAGAQTDAAAANAQTALAIYMDTVQNALPDYIRGIQGGGLQMAASGMDPTAYYAAGRNVIDNISNGGLGNALASGAGQAGTGSTGKASDVGSQAYFDKLEGSGLSPSLGGSLGTKLGLNYVDPSMLNKAVAGDWQGIGEQLVDPARYLMKEGLGGTWYDPAGLFSNASRKDKPTNYDQYGRPEDNAAAAGDYDWQGYYDTQPDLQEAYASQNPTQKKWALASYDNNGDGELGTDEFTQMWWNAHGKNNPDRVDGMSYFKGAGATGPSSVLDATGAEGGAGATASANALQGYGSSDWEKAFRDSGFHKYGLGSAMRAKDTLYAQAGAGGTSLSGAQKKALDDRQTQIMGQGAFNNWYGSLSGALPTNQLASAAQNYGITTTNATNQNANALSSMYANQRDPYADAFGAAYKGISKQQGWI